SFTAIADGKAITHYDAGFRAIAGGGGKGAGLESEAIRLFEPKAKSDRVFDLAGAKLVAVDPHGRLYAATQHEVYEENARGELSRLARADATTPAPNVDAVRAQTWTTNVQPIFARRCASCHLPGGSSGVDLSTFDAWIGKRALVRKRVVDTRTMPPKGNPIDD